MSAVVLFVELDIVPGQREAFLARAQEHRENVQKNEPDCKCFDISVPENKVNKVRLYEVYADQVAFDHHMETEYMMAYRADTGSMVANRQLTKEARTELNKSIVIIRATYDENNRVTIERDRLIEGLGEPINLEARHKFISDYLTSSDDIRNKCDLFRKTEF